MKNDEEIFEEGKIDDEDLLDFAFDELSGEDAEKAGGDSASEGRIIELVDIVDDSEIDEIAKLLDEEQPIEDKKEIEEAATYFALDEIRESEEGVSPSLESDLSSTFETLESPNDNDIDFELLESDLRSELDAESFERTTFDIEDLAEDEEFIEMPGGQGPDAQEEALPEHSIGSADIPQEEFERDTLSPKAEQFIGITEERMEAIITRVVQDVVERVARETMTTVAEKMITEAIAALTRSLESPQD
jgi:hypothetical protein